MELLAAILFILLGVLCIGYSVYMLSRDLGWDWVTLAPPEQAVNAPIYKFWHSRRKKLEQQIQKQ